MIRPYKTQILTVVLLVLTVLLLAGLAIIFTSCSSSDTRYARQESERAYQDFRKFVTGIENEGSFDTSNWQQAANKSRQAYEEKISTLNQHYKNFDESRRQEIEALKGRYNTYWDKHVSQYNAQATTVHGGLAADFRIEELATTTPANIRQAYESLISTIQANKENYTQEDWKAINAYYLALDKRKNMVQSALSDKDKYEIAKAKARYVALRTEARFDPDVSKTASELGNTVEKAGTTIQENINSGAAEVGRASEKVATEVKENTREGAGKIGQAATKTGQEVKSTARHLRNKADEKIDDDPEKR